MQKQSKGQQHQRQKWQRQTWQRQQQQAATVELSPASGTVAIELTAGLNSIISDPWLMRAVACLFLGMIAR